MMVLSIQSDDTNLKLWLPTFIIKAKFFFKLISKSDETKEMIKMTSTLYKNIKQYTKKYGHFNLVEIIDKDGSLITIRV